MNKNIMQVAGFGKEVEMAEKGLCPLCQEAIYIYEFRDVLSVKEYGISGLCQKCQDKIFG